MLVKIILGLVLAAIGGLMTIKANALYEGLGPIPWAEQHLGSEGGSRLMYKLLGIGLTVIGFLIMTGLLQNAILAIFSRIFVGFIPQQQ